ncbi:hypothetical protein VTK73DRAFT_552 [Phialemonium thermophilum]|uniref:Uncharacterized protein n=1 Tax=Phialemonium thermophilum TaxID=223376 RepID=A0ABR3VUV5_9PEZI
MEMSCCSTIYVYPATSCRSHLASLLLGTLLVFCPALACRPLLLSPASVPCFCPLLLSSASVPHCAYAPPVLPSLHANNKDQATTTTVRRDHPVHSRCRNRWLNSLTATATMRYKKARPLSSPMGMKGPLVPPRRVRLMPVRSLAMVWTSLSGTSHSTARRRLRISRMRA